jgi:hypothetical protein
VDYDLGGSRAILIGNASYRSDSGIPDLPAAAGSVAEMADLLAGDLCRWPTDRIVQMLDIAAPHELARRLAGAVKGVQDVILLYYVGHGLRTAKGQFALTLSDSDADPTLVGHTAILYESIAGPCFAAYRCRTPGRSRGDRDYRISLPPFPLAYIAVWLCPRRRTCRRFEPASPRSCRAARFALGCL